MSCWPPQLPFDEALRPAAVYLAVRNPKLFVKQFSTAQFANGRYHKLAMNVLEDLSLPVPAELEQAGKGLVCDDTD